MLELVSVDSFYGKAQALYAVGFSVGRGRVAALLGRNGAGKTTTLKSIMQLVHPRSGRVVVDGRDVAGLPPHAVARMGVGYVPEDRRVFADLTVEENLEAGRRPAREGVAAWTEETLFDLFPNLAERRGSRGRERAGGERQMLAVARALMGNPRLLLLDEPSEGVAPAIVERMAGTILRLKSEGLTVLMSEQNLGFARAVADSAIVIEGGWVSHAGTFEDLDATPRALDAHLSL